MYLALDRKENRWLRLKVSQGELDIVDGKEDNRVFDLVTSYAIAIWCFSITGVGTNMEKRNMYRRGSTFSIFTSIKNCVK